MIELITELIRLIRQVFDFSLSGKVIQRTVDIYDSMSHIVSETDAKRVAIFRAHNGGGKLKADSPIYISCIHEVYLAPFVSFKEDLQNFSIDAEFLRMLKEIDLSGAIAFRPADIPDCLIKEIYTREGVRYVEIYKLKATRNYFYYCSISTDRFDTDLIDPINRALLKLETNKIKQNIR